MTPPYEKRIYRILEIIVLLENSYKKWSAGELANYFDVSKRTFFRDQEVMKEAGIPIKHNEELGTYYLEDEFKFSVPELDQKQAVALTLICQGFDNDNFPYYQELEKARAKLFNSLPSSMQKIIKERAKQIFVEPRINVDLFPYRDIISQIEKAMDRNHKIEINYYSMGRDEETNRKISPYSLVFKEGACYLIGLCHLREEKRIFRVDRINDLQILADRFQKPESFSLDEYFDDSWGVEQGTKQKIVVHFSGYAARFVEEGDWHDSQKIERIAEDKIKFTVETGSIQELKRWILSFGKEAKVIEPEGLREEMKNEIKELSKKY